MDETNEIYEIVDPSPVALIESNCAFGYSPETSISDLPANSITTRASSQCIDFIWNETNFSVKRIQIG